MILLISVLDAYDLERCAQKAAHQSLLLAPNGRMPTNPVICFVTDESGKPLLRPKLVGNYVNFCQDDATKLTALCYDVAERLKFAKPGARRREHSKMNGDCGEEKLAEGVRVAGAIWIFGGLLPAGMNEAAALAVSVLAGSRGLAPDNGFYNAFRAAEEYRNKFFVDLWRSVANESGLYTILS